MSEKQIAITPKKPNGTRARLDDPEVRKEFWKSIIKNKSVQRACVELGLSRTEVYVKAHEEEDFAAEMLAAEAANMRQMIDDIIEITNVPLQGKREVDYGLMQKARLQVETYMRLAGKLIPKIYGDMPGAGTTINVGVQVAQTSTEEERKNLQAMREKLLLKKQGGAAVARLAHNQKAEGSTPSPANSEITSEIIEAEVIPTENNTP